MADFLVASLVLLSVLWIATGSKAFFPEPDARTTRMAIHITWIAIAYLNIARWVRSFTRKRRER